MVQEMYKNWMNWIHDDKLFDQLLHISGQICPYFQSTTSYFCANLPITKQNQYVSGTETRDFGINTHLSAHVGEVRTGRW